MGEDGFGHSESAVLEAVLDALIPPSADGKLPGAGELGLAPGVAERFGAMRSVVAASLHRLDALARERGAAGFAALDAGRREALLREYAEADPGLVPGLVFQTYAAYYEHPRVQQALGLEPRPPHPKGYALEQPDLDALLARVKKGPRRYREV